MYSALHVDMARALALSLSRLSLGSRRQFHLIAKLACGPCISWPRGRLACCISASDIWSGNARRTCIVMTIALRHHRNKTVHACD